MPAPKGKPLKGKPAAAKPPVRQRESDLHHRPFPFEVARHSRPANNMAFFHWHDFVEISFVESGEGRYEIEGRAFTVAEGDAVVINNVERHRVTWPPECPLVETVLHFSPALLDPGGAGQRPADAPAAGFRVHGYCDLFRYRAGGGDNRPRLDEGARAAVRALVREIVAEYEDRRPHRELMIRALLLTLVTRLLRARAPETRAAAGGAPPARKRDLLRLEGILDHIRVRFAGELTLASLARRFGVSPSYFSDFFRRNVGVSLTEYITRVRVHEAMRLLNEGRLSSTETAFAVGFRNLASFYKAFRRVAGGSPKQVRERIETEENPKQAEEIPGPFTV